MSKIVTIHGAIELTRDGATVFSGIGALVPGETRTLATRVGIGFGEVTGICTVTGAVPGLAAGTLTIEQSVDGVTYDQVDAFPMGPATVQPFALKVIARFVRARFSVPVGEIYDIRFGGIMKPISSP